VDEYSDFSLESPRTSWRRRPH